MENEQPLLMMDEPGPNNDKVYKKLYEILADVGSIAKDKQNTAQNYSYLSEQAIKERLQPLLVKHRLLWTPYNAELLRVDQVSDSKQRVTTIKIFYRWYDIDSGQFINGAMVGSGADSMDKGTYKALTGALKYVMTTTFVIPTGDDPENAGNGSAERRSPQRASGEGQPQQRRGPSNPDAKISDAQRKRIFALMHKANKTADQVKQIVTRYGFEHSEDITLGKYEAICAEVEKA